MTAWGPVYLDSFSGAAADLPKGRRSAAHVLEVLRKHPRVSTWDLSEHPWLRAAIDELLNAGAITAVPEAYPWQRYEVTTPRGAGAVIHLPR